MTSTASQASLHLPILLAFNGLEGGSLIFMLSMSIRQTFFLKFCVITVLVLSKLSRLDQSVPPPPPISCFFFSFVLFCCNGKGVVEQIASPPRPVLP